MDNQLKVLIIEDSATDAELAVISLRRTWPQVNWQRVDSETDFRRALSTEPDVIIADYEVPGFGALAALRILGELGSDVPLIVFTGAVTEEIVVRCMRLGAADYLLKDRLTRLGPAISNALDLRRQRAEKLRTEREQQRLAALNSALLNSMQAQVALIDKHGVIVATNDAWRRSGMANGYCNSAWTVGTNYVSACAHARSDNPDYNPVIAAGVREVLAGAQDSFTLEYPCHSAWQKLALRMMVTPVIGDVALAHERSGGAVVMHVNVTEQRAAMDQLRINSNALQHLTEGVVITDAHLHIVTVNQAFTAITGYDAKEAKDQPLGTVIAHDVLAHSDDDLRTEVLDSGWRGELQARRRNGERFPALFSLSAVRNHRGEIEYYTGVLSDLSSIRDIERRIDYLSHHDALTGLPNRTALETRLRAVLASPAAAPMVAFFLIELDRFKMINDTLGHRAGDMLINAVTQRLYEEIQENDVLARLGGDEFVLLRPGLQGQDNAISLAEKIRIAMEQPFVLDGRQLFITTSIGISCYPGHGSDFETLLRTADAAVYAAKQRGRNAVSLYSTQEAAAASERFTLQNSLPQALAQRELRLEYQPTVDLQNGRVTGVEALLRWRHPQLGLIPPGRFIDIAEETGIIVPIGEWVLHTACAQVQRWQANGWTLPTVAVNLSARQFAQTNLPTLIDKILCEYRLQPQQLRLEVTESMMMSDPATAARLVETLADMGIEVALDDFGTGYSSLSYLQRFRIACLKVDRSFVSGAPINHDAQSIVRAVVALGKTLSMKVVAEGVETPGQAAFLREAGCDDAQGYYYSKPVPADIIPSLVTDIPRRFPTRPARPMPNHDRAH